MEYFIVAGTYFAAGICLGIMIQRRITTRLRRILLDILNIVDVSQQNDIRCNDAVQYIFRKNAGKL
jgi:hypothetical protein